MNIEARPGFGTKKLTLVDETNESCKASDCSEVKQESLVGKRSCVVLMLIDDFKEVGRIP